MSESESSGVDRVAGRRYDEPQDGTHGDDGDVVSGWLNGHIGRASTCAVIKHCNDSRHRHPGPTKRKRRQFSCDSCPKMFCNAYGMKRHMRGVCERSTAYRTQCCERLSARQDRAHTHHATVHPGCTNCQVVKMQSISRYIYGCGMCRNYSTSIEQFIRHQRDHCEERRPVSGWTMTTKFSSLMYWPENTDGWNAILEKKAGGFHVEAFNIWCLNQKTDIIAILDGTASIHLKQTSQEHVQYALDKMTRFLDEYITSLHLSLTYRVKLPYRDPPYSVQSDYSPEAVHNNRSNQSQDTASQEDAKTETDESMDLLSSIETSIWTDTDFGDLKIPITEDQDFMQLDQPAESSAHTLKGVRTRFEFDVSHASFEDFNNYLGSHPNNLEYIDAHAINPGAFGHQLPFFGLQGLSQDPGEAFDWPFGVSDPWLFQNE